MSNGVVQEWYRKCKDSPTGVHDEGGKGHKSIASNESSAS